MSMQSTHDSEQTANGMKKQIAAVTDDACLHPPAGLTDRLKAATDSGNRERAEEILWETLESFAGYPFKTAKGLAFTYFVKGNELFFTRKEKSVTRASVRMAFEAAVRLQSAGVEITGPKMLGCFGASYLYPVFIQIGVIGNGVEESKNDEH